MSHTHQPRTCDSCGITFEPASPAAKYCAACRPMLAQAYSRWYREKRAEDPEYRAKRSAVVAKWRQNLPLDKIEELRKKDREQKRARRQTNPEYLAKTKAAQARWRANKNASMTQEEKEAESARKLENKRRRAPERNKREREKSAELRTLDPQAYEARLARARENYREKYRESMRISRAQRRENMTDEERAKLKRRERELSAQRALLRLQHDMMRLQNDNPDSNSTPE